MCHNLSKVETGTRFALFTRLAQDVFTEENASRFSSPEGAVEYNVDETSPAPNGVQ